ASPHLIFRNRPFAESRRDVPCVGPPDTRGPILAPEFGNVLIICVRDRARPSNQGTSPRLTGRQEQHTKSRKRSHEYLNHNDYDKRSRYIEYADYIAKADAAVARGPTRLRSGRPWRSSPGRGRLSIECLTSRIDHP